MEYNHNDYENIELQTRNDHRILKGLGNDSIRALYRHNDSVLDFRLLFIICISSILTAIISNFISKTSVWLLDIKKGTCTYKYYLNKTLCCLVYEDEKKCKEWKNWISEYENTNLGFFKEHVIYILVNMVIAAILVIILKKYKRRSDLLHGIEHLKDYFINKKNLTFKDYFQIKKLLIKIIVLCLVGGGNMALDMESLLPYIACTIAYYCLVKTNTTVKQRHDTLEASSAVGFCIALNAPIGGILYHLEEIHTSSFPLNIRWNSFFGAIIGLLILRHLNGKYASLFDLNELNYSEDNWKLFELLFFVLISIISGVTGSWFIKCSTNIKNTINSAQINTKAAMFLIVVLLSSISFLVEYLRYGNIPLINMMLSKCSDKLMIKKELCNQSTPLAAILFNIAIVIATKTVFLLSMFALEVPGGLLIPITCVGSLLGRAFGIIVNRIHLNYPALFIFTSCPSDKPCIYPEAYAMIGAVSMMASTTRKTLSIVVIMFELSGRLNYVLPIMISILLSKAVSMKFVKNDLFTNILCNERGLAKNSVNLDICVGDIMQQIVDQDILCTKSTTKEINQRIRNIKLEIFIFVDNLLDKRYQGYCCADELIHY